VVGSVAVFNVLVGIIRIVVVVVVFGPLDVIFARRVRVVVAIRPPGAAFVVITIAGIGFFLFFFCSFFFLFVVVGVQTHDVVVVLLLEDRVQPQKGIAEEVRPL
jgi:hypothetical protein